MGKDSEHVYKELRQINKKNKIIQFKKMKKKYLYRNLQEDSQMTNKHMKHCSTLLGNDNQNHNDTPLQMCSAE